MIKRIDLCLAALLCFAAPAVAQQWGVDPVQFWPDSVGVQLVPPTAAVRVRLQELEPHFNNFSCLFRGDSVGVLPVIGGSTVTFLFTVYDSTGYVIFEKELDVFNSFSTAVAELQSAIAQGFFLAQNYPNPFNPTTQISFQLPQSGEVTLAIYNILGQLIRTLAQGKRPAGYYTMEWDGRNDRGETVPSGVYFYRLESGSFQAMKKMIMMK